MAAVPFPPSKRLSKSTLSMYLRTKCDRELYLSLHEESILLAQDMPVGLPARPGIGVLQTAGRTFEEDRNAQLIQIFGQRVIYQPTATGGAGQAPLATLLQRVSVYPSFILQARFEPSTFQQRALQRIGVDPSAIALIPRMSGLIPDIILVRNPTTGEEELRSDGTRIQIDALTERRKALSITDIKHTSEANASYSAEVSLYALFLANWLLEEGLSERYYVSSRNYLWTRFKQGDSELDKLFSGNPQAAPADLLNALVSDSEDANLRFYIATAIRFFREDLPRVIRIGDARRGGWADLEWHVDNRCSACDWLGLERWASRDSKAIIAAKPSHYCYSAALQLGHLSRIAGMTRGARKTLLTHSIADTASVATVSSSHVAFQLHTHLKKERGRIPLRAQALGTNVTTVDTGAVLASLSPAPKMHVAVSINFDASAGLLTGLALQGVATAYRQGESPRRFVPVSFVVDQKSLGAEWIALEGFLTTLSNWIDQTEAYLQQFGSPALTAQIAFWEKRQFLELCNAMGRHLPKVFALTQRRTRALAWLFPAEELLEKQDGAVSPCVVFIDEIVQRVVFAPTPHVVTLFDASENYYPGSFRVTQGDAFYREFLTNGIPRERIYEIWSGVQVIRRGTQTLPRNTVITEYGNALVVQSRALNTVVERLRADFRGQLRANAPTLSLAIPRGAQNVAFDSKLWVWWDELEFQTSKLASFQRVALDADALEANYDALRLTNGRSTASPFEFSYDVLPGSTEAKLDDDEGFLAIGVATWPGFSLERVSGILSSQRPAFRGDQTLLSRPVWSVISAKLVSLDRANRKAVVRFLCWPDQNLIPYLFQHSSVSLLQDIFLVKGISTFKWHDTSKKILEGIGNPAVATPDANAARAMGMAPAPPGRSPLTPAAEVLWDAANFQSRSVISAQRAAAISAYVSASDGLNPSQQGAVTHAAEHGLTVVWGPPGTGKTKTLSALLHGVVHDAVANREGLKILITGPTYKAVEELVSRALALLDGDASCSCDLFVAYGRSQATGNFQTSGQHVTVKSFHVIDGSQDMNACVASLSDQSIVTLVATGVMQAHKFSQTLFGRPVAPVFDLVVIDESSQVQVTRALAPLATMKEGVRLVVAGDHLQMPPIMALEPPVGAEYLVGSIQAYLRTRQFPGGVVQECALEENYRSAEEIVAFARSIGYKASLTAVYPQTAVHQLNQLPNLTNGFPANLPWSTIWAEIVKPDNKVMTLLHEDDLSSQGNYFEAKIVAAVVWSLRYIGNAELAGRGNYNLRAPSAAEFWGKSVGIVTPHRAQRALVIRELLQTFPADPVALIEEAVDTVEKFQGGERHSIIVTFGVADTDIIEGEESFLMQLERTNVAISRAMAKCLVIMPMTLAGHVPQEKKALSTAHAIKGYVDEFCNQEIATTISFANETRVAKLRYRQ